MKITIVQGAFFPIPPIHGGAVEKIWYRLGIEFSKSGNEVFHIGKRVPTLPEKEIKNGVQYIRVRGFSAPKSLILLKILDLFYSIIAIAQIPKDSDIIVTNTFWAPIFIRGNSKKKVFVDIQRVPRWQMKFYTHVFKLRANSTPVADAIKSIIQPSYHNKIVTIPNPLPFDSISTYALESKSKTILYVGRIHPEKGIDILIDSFRSLNTTGFTLKIIGPWEIALGGGGNEYFEKLKTLIKDLKNIQFIGPIFDEKILNTYYKEASIFVYPSVAEIGETFGLAPLEAMAWGCVPIVSRLACFSDYIFHNENGMIFDHNHTERVKLLEGLIKKLIEDKMFRLKLANEAVKVNQTHSISVIATNFLEEFNKKT